MIRTMQLLNSSGDITIGWTEDQAPVMIEVISRKMAEGYTFFILEDNGNEIRLKKPEQLLKVSSVIIGDRDAEELIRNGKIGIVDVVSKDTSEVVVKGYARNPKQVVESNTIASKPLYGG